MVSIPKHYSRGWDFEQMLNVYWLELIIPSENSVLWYRGWFTQLKAKEVVQTIRYNKEAQRIWNALTVPISLTLVMTKANCNVIFSNPYSFIFFPVLCLCTNSRAPSWCDVFAHRLRSITGCLLSHFPSVIKNLLLSSFHFSSYQGRKIYTIV